MQSYPWLEILNPQVVTGMTRSALFDFDGTLSVIRRGWNEIMAAVMIEMIADGHPVGAEIETEVNAFVERSAGILTIIQMQWLEAAVRRHGLARQVLSAAEYKRIYNQRLLKPVRERLSGVEAHPEQRDTLMLAGARAFLEALAGRGVKLFLASGTDHEYVLAEAGVLGIAELFEGRIYGAKGDSEVDSKGMVITRILEENHLRGEELLVVGDGPVEIRHARAVGAVALGVASDEETRRSFNPRKRAALSAAGADLLVSHYLPTAEVVGVFAPRPLR